MEYSGSSWNMQLAHGITDPNTREDIIHHVSNEMTDRHVAEMETPTSKRKTKLSTLQSWNYDWLAYEQGGSYVTMVWCRICRAHHNARVAQGSKKQNQLCDLDAYIKGTANVKRTRLNAMRSQTSISDVSKKV